MTQFRIFTESPADVKFLKDYINGVLGISLSDIHFDTLGGWAGYKTGGNIKASIKENNDDERITIIILDADTDFSARQQEVINDFKKYNIPIQLFLFPNNLNIGSLETLLSEIAVERGIINCFEQYEHCIQGYQAPVDKSKIFAYLDALLPKNAKNNNKKDVIKEENRNYLNEAHWNLNHEFLSPLKAFLLPHIL